MMTEKMTGQCACGKVEFCFEGDPINSAFCYCTECQKHTGSDKWFGLWIPLDNLSFTKGSPSTYTRLGDSEKAMNHKFCSHCGTTLCVEVTVGNFYSVAVSTLKEANQFSPNICIYTASAPSWAVFPEGVPKFDVLPPEIEG
jgi:hypothetical protein